MISFYKWKKNAIFITLGIIPLLIFLLIFFPTIQWYTFEGIRFMYLDYFNVMLAIIFAMITAIIIMIFGNRLLRHAFTTMLEGKGLITLVLDSTGVIGSFNTQVAAPKMRGVFADKNTPPIEDIYDVDLLHRLMVPKNAGMTKAITFEKNDKGEMIFGDPVEVLVLPQGKDKYENMFAFENKPVFIYNKVMNKYLSRDSLAKYEKDLEIKHNALNILRKVQETDVNFRNFGRYIGENIKPIKKGLFFGSSMVKYLIIGSIVALIIFVLLMFLPGILQAGSKIGFPM